jgi:hypothetical protein
MEYIEEIDLSYATDVYEWNLTEALIPGTCSSNTTESKHL